jgi:competence ComEA-like helix-hairpin-helix protein
MFDFTREERQAIIFVVSLALAGISINYLAKRFLPNKQLKSIVQDLGKVDLNTADKGQLMSVPGIKQKLAERIIAYRERQMGFSSVEELKNIKGLSGLRLQKAREYLLIR